MYEKPEKRSGLVCCLLILALFGIYVGSYLCLLVFPCNALGIGSGDDRSGRPHPDGRVVWNEQYRFGGAAASVFFWPANQIDRMVRSDGYTVPPTF